VQAQLETLSFIQPPAAAPLAVLGVVASRAGTQATRFHVPAHALATLNLVLSPSLSESGEADRGRLSVLHDGRWRALPRAFATGAQMRHRTYCLEPGSVLVSALLRADALPSEVAQASANAWWPAARMFATWNDASWPAARWADAAAALMQHTTDAASPGHGGASERLRAATRLLQQHSVVRTAEHLGISERALQRLFAQAWGLSPKRVQRLVRVQEGLQRWHAAQQACNRSITLAALAADCGLADQAHLAREFRELIGHAPRTLKGGGLELAGQVEVFRQTWSRFV
jgi:AraC-like DNA-binding protein